MLEFLRAIAQHVQPFPLVTGVNPIRLGQDRCDVLRKCH
jgi:hypothetical protein